MSDWMSLYLLDVAAGPVIIAAIIILLVVLAIVIGLIYFAVVFIRKIKKEEDSNFKKE